MKEDKGYFQIQCNKCQKVATFSIPADKCRCQECGEILPLKRKSAVIKQAGTILAATAIGFSIANAPEWLQTKNDIVKLYEAMNACMKYANYYSKQRDYCACALAETYENHKWLQDPKKRFQKNLHECEKD